MTCRTRFFRARPNTIAMPGPGAQAKQIIRGGIARIKVVFAWINP
jgi:hypothetical protein